jgi:hypothetical protein
MDFASLNAALVKWLWVSINPGITLLPFKSILSLPGLAKLSASEVLPTNFIIPPSVTMASTQDESLSMQLILPL